MPGRGVLRSPDTRFCIALAYWTGVQTLPPARVFSSWVLQDHRHEMVEAMAGSRSKTRRENLLMRFLEYLPIRRGSGVPQKPSSWLSEGVWSAFTTHTETGEKLVSRTSKSSGPPCPRGRWCGSISFRPFPRNGCRNAWETVV